MTPETDSDCLRQYIEHQSESAFASLVERHVHLVYSVAFRQTGDAHQAKEITQAVFIILARKAAQLRHERALGSWLFRTTRLTANNFLRSELRRRAREQEAYMQSHFDRDHNAASPNPDPAWQQLVPLLDAAVETLGETDRRALVLRFYEGRPLREVGAILGATEAAAKKRVGRALEKLRRYFGKRGLTLSVGVITTAITGNAVPAAPVGLAKTISAVARAKGVAASIPTLTLVKGALKVMAWAKVKTAIIVGVCILLTPGVSIVVLSQTQKYHASKIVNAFVENHSANSSENDPDFQKVKALGAAAVPYLVSIIEKYDSIRDTPPHPPSGHAEGRDLMRIRAYWGLEYLHASATSAVPFLIQEFSPNNDLIDFDFRVLAGLGPEARDSIPVLNRAFHGDDSRLRWYAARALAKIDPENSELLPAMLAELDNSDVIARRFACIVLGDLGSRAKPAVPTLTVALNDKDEWVRKNAMEALKMIGVTDTAERRP